MTEIEELGQIEAILNRFINTKGRHSSLEVTTQLMKLLDNPERHLKVIHIAGTSGKTSTAYYLSRLLTLAGCRTGLTISPHVDRVTERIQINGSPLSDQNFIDYLKDIVGRIDSTNLKPSYFEVLVALALYVFKNKHVDYAVVETGIGGLSDATNVTKNQDKVCLLSDIGYDHQRQLGNNLSAIARQKVGIVHPGNHLIMQVQAEPVMRVVESYVIKQTASLQILDSPDLPAGLKGGHLARFQVRNWSLAYQAYLYLQRRDNLKELTLSQLRETIETPIVGRLETHSLDNRRLILDGAHNETEIVALKLALEELYPELKPTFLVAAKKSLAAQASVDTLSQLASKVIVTSPSASNSAGKLAVANSLAGKIAAKGTDSQVIMDAEAAFKELLDSSAQLLVVTGSLYLIAEIRSRFSDLLKDQAVESPDYVAVII